ncbi:MAG: tetratricopeptide repeat protein [Tannerellaceae bacterium]|jgi:tetratricopeptide (TPR) repeat protein|nr:tetratricopeptide repeat protein [Tannerellaceae bacterium]
MKRVLFSMVLLMAATLSFAQVKAVKEAKSIAGETNPDFGKAEQLINGALKDTETKNDAATWDVAGFIQKRINEKQMESAYLKKPYDTIKVYSSVLNMYKYYLKCDELAQVPDEKGKIKNRYRKANATILLAERPNLINGGIHYFNQDKNEEALSFFAMYVDASSNPIFEKENLLQIDTILPQVAYYAALTAAKMENYPAVLKYAPYAADDKEVGKYAMEFVSTAYKIEAKNEDDTLKWVASLKEGVQKYSDHPFFFGHLIDYYSNTNKYDEAMAFADEMLQKYPDNAFYLYVKGYLHHNLKEYDNAINYYKKTTVADPNYAEAYSNLGLIYVLKAQEFADSATVDVNSPKYAQEQEIIKKFYEEAKPCYEKARELKPQQQDLWIQGLYRIYYNLNMGTEFEEIEKLMGI